MALKPSQNDAHLRSWLSDLVHVLDAEVGLVQERIISLSAKTSCAALETAIRRVRSLVDDEISFYARCYNQRCRTYSLPAELLSAIFQHLDLAGLITASHICHDWRSVALDTSSLWSDVRSLHQAPGVLASRLERIPFGTPLNLTTAITNMRYHEVSGALRDRLPDLRSLWLRLDLKLDDYRIPSVSMALSQPAPALTHMALMCAYEITHQLLQRYPLLANDAPALRSMKYYGTLDAIRDWSLIPQLRTVLFSQPEYSTLSTISSVLEVFQNAETLGIEVDDWEGLGAHAAGTVLTLPSTLRGLVILSNANDVDPRDLISSIPHGSIPSFAAGYSTGTTLEAQASLVTEVSHALGQPVKCMIIGAVPDENDARLVVRLYTQRSRQERVLLHTAFSLRDGVQAFRSLTAVYFLETLLPTDSGVYEMPSVTTLGIILLRRGAQTRRGHASVFLLENAHDPLLVCPALTQIVFVAHFGTRTALSPDLIRAFVHWHVQCPRPLRLGLSDVDLVESNVEEVAALLSLVDDVVFESCSDVTQLSSGRESGLPDIAHVFYWGGDID